MKEIFEIDMKGNKGVTIDKIKSFKMHSEEVSGAMGLDEIINYDITLVFRNGTEQTLSFKDYKGF